MYFLFFCLTIYLDEFLQIISQRRFERSERLLSVIESSPSKKDQGIFPWWIIKYNLFIYIFN